MRWITRERPKIDRIACPWLVRRFIDPDAEFLFVNPALVMVRAVSENAIPFDVPDVELSHEGPLCSFDAFLRKFALDEPSLHRLAVIVRGADTGQLDLAPQCAGLLAISLGLSRNIVDDQAMLEAGMVVYDALHTWCSELRDESHSWPPSPPT